MTTSEAAAKLGVTRSRIRQLILSGQLKATMQGRDWWIEPETVAAFHLIPVGYPKGKPRMSKKKMATPELVVRFSDDGLWGSTDPDTEGYDASQSAASFETMLQARLRSDYPDWDVTIDHRLEDDARLDGLPDFEERPAVDDIIHEVWESMAWAVKGEVLDTRTPAHTRAGPHPAAPQRGERMTVNEWEMRYKALAAGITDQRMIDNAERIVETAVRMAATMPASLEDVFYMVLQAIQVQQPSSAPGADWAALQGRGDAK